MTEMEAHEARIQKVRPKGAWERDWLEYIKSIPMR
jgi:hypothetical protein